MKTINDGHWLRLGQDWEGELSCSVTLVTLFVYLFGERRFHHFQVQPFHMEHTFGLSFAM